MHYRCSILALLLSLHPYKRSLQGSHRKLPASLLSRSKGRPIYKKRSETITHSTIYSISYQSDYIVPTDALLPLPASSIHSPHRVDLLLEENLYSYKFTKVDTADGSRNVCHCFRIDVFGDPLAPLYEREPCGLVWGWG